MNHNILIVEDDDNLRETLVDNLELEGFQLYSANSIAQAKSILAVQQIDLIVLDVMLPDGTGYQLCQWLQGRTNALLLMLTARTLERDVVEGFVSGCDDYVSKPYRAKELLLRIRALLRRNDNGPKAAQFSSTDKVNINGFIVNWDLHEIHLDEQPVHITKTAFDILRFLFVNQNKSCSRDDILNAVWGQDIFVDNRTVDNFVSHLKKQLLLVDGKEYWIKTIRGVGYSLLTGPQK